MKKLEDFKQIFFNNFKRIEYILIYNDYEISIFKYNNEFYLLRTISGTEYHIKNLIMFEILIQINKNLLKEYLLRKLSDESVFKNSNQLILIKSLHNNKIEKTLYEFYEINYNEFMFLYDKDYTSLDSKYCYKKYTENEILNILENSNEKT